MNSNCMDPSDPQTRLMPGRTDLSLKGPETEHSLGRTDPSDPQTRLTPGRIDLSALCNTSKMYIKRLYPEEDLSEFPIDIIAEVCRQQFLLFSSISDKARFDIRYASNDILKECVKFGITSHREFKSIMGRGPLGLSNKLEKIRKNHFINIEKYKHQASHINLLYIRHITPQINNDRLFCTINYMDTTNHKVNITTSISITPAGFEPLKYSLRSMKREPLLDTKSNMTFPKIIVEFEPSAVLILRNIDRYITILPENAEIRFTYGGFYYKDKGKWTRFAMRISHSTPETSCVQLIIYNPLRKKTHVCQARKLLTLNNIKNPKMYLTEMINTLKT